jgi:uncharacterized DUF497 family protein
MRFHAFDWDHDNIDHIAEHSVTTEEVEEACYNRPLVFRTRQEKYCVLGRSDSGRYLTVIITVQDRNKIRVVTARDMSGSERQRFYRR